VPLAADGLLILGWAVAAFVPYTGGDDPGFGHRCVCVCACVCVCDLCLYVCMYLREIQTERFCVSKRKRKRERERESGGKKNSMRETRIQGRRNLFFVHTYVII